MKKYAVAVLILAVCAGFAFASTVKVPWYVDSANPETGNPPSSKVLGMVTLTSNADETVTCKVYYYDAGGTDVGHDVTHHGTETAMDNTFLIAPRSSLAWRPVQYDPSALVETGKTGQEGPQGVVVPDRNTSDGKKNGSIVVEWTGDVDLIQGMVVYIKGGSSIVSYAHLLPSRWPASLLNP